VETAGSTKNAGEAGAESGSDPGGTSTPGPAAADFRKVQTAGLPATQGVSPKLDGGRLQLPLLASWIVPPRSSKWLFRLQRDRRTAYPQILVTVEEAFSPQVEKLNENNVADFIPVWQQHLEKTHDAKSFGEPVSAVRIGKLLGAECLIHAAAGKSSLDRLMVATIGAGRVYVLELRVQRGTLEDYRMDFYAVVAGTIIEPPTTTPGGLEPPSTPPTDEETIDQAPTGGAAAAAGPTADSEAK
jgi:hypothetical protein